MNGGLQIDLAFDEEKLAFLKINNELIALLSKSESLLQSLTIPNTPFLLSPSTIPFFKQYRADSFSSSSSHLSG
jgi:hypothetical protein